MHPDELLGPLGGGGNGGDDVRVDAFLLGHLIRGRGIAVDAHQADTSRRGIDKLLQGGIVRAGTYLCQGGGLAHHEQVEFRALAGFRVECGKLLDKQRVRLFLDAVFLQVRHAAEHIGLVQFQLLRNCGTGKYHAGDAVIRQRDAAHAAAADCYLYVW